MPELVPNFTIPLPTPLNSIMPQGIRPLIIINNIPFKQYTTTLFSSSSSEFSPTPPTKIVDKGKSEATNEDLMKQLMPFIEQGGSAQKIPNLQQFSTSGKRMTLNDAKAQMEEMKRLADLKAKKEESEKRLKALTDEELKAQAAKLAAYEADEVYLAFGRHLEEIHVTWAHLEKKRTRLQTYTNISQDYSHIDWRRRHQLYTTPSQPT
ncbi:hypothetical protein Tco_0408794 [Tanacetum coccineum]